MLNTISLTRQAATCHATVCWKLSSNTVIVCMFLPRRSGKDSVKLRGADRHTWGVAGTADRCSPLSERRQSKTVSITCCLWYPPVWLLVSDGVGRHTTTMNAVGCQVEIPNRCTGSWLPSAAAMVNSSTTRAGFFLSYQAETPFTKGGGTPGLNLALEDWSCLPMS